MYRQHNHRINDPAFGIVLRPLNDEDWFLLAKWNLDPEVLYYSEGDDISSYSLTEVRFIYESVSQKADIFIIEKDGISIGECWLQDMNIKLVIEQFYKQTLYRIDIMIGEKDYWNMGIGSRVIGLLTEYGFENKKADIIFGVVEDYNQRSIHAFTNNGYEELLRKSNLENSKGKEEIFLGKRKF